MISFMISVVPPKIDWTRLSRRSSQSRWSSGLGPVSNSAARAASAPPVAPGPAAWAATARLRRVAHSRSAATLRRYGRAVPGMMSGDSGGSVR